MVIKDKCEAIVWLSNIKEKYIHGGDEEFDECRRESIDMAIKALRQPQIVRCKDCKYCNEDTMECNIRSGWFAVSPNWFCADGQRKDSD